MNTKENGKKPKEQFRVVINRESNEALESFVQDLGITKSDLANYLFTNLSKLIGDGQLTEIRAIYFDARKALEGILKGSSQGAELPENIREALLKHCGIKSTVKEKREKKLSTPKIVDNSKVG